MLAGALLALLCGLVPAQAIDRVSLRVADVLNPAFALHDIEAVFDAGSEGVSPCHQTPAWSIAALSAGSEAEIFFRSIPDKRCASANGSSVFS